MICVSVGRTRHKMMIAEHKALAERGAELVELRLDWLSHAPDLSRLLKTRPTPVVITCRRDVDKGRWSGSEEQRLTLLRSAIVSGAEYVDLEEDVAGQIRRYGKTQRIVSHHDFTETPDDIEAIHERLCKLDPDIVKLVTMANTPGDSIRMLQLVAKSKVPTVGFCMGEQGVFSRVLAGKYGAPFTYATFNRDRELAPGQLSFDDMKNIYRYDSIGPETQVFGVIGDPIGHSLSPLIHNTAYAALGMNAVYLPFRVPKDVLDSTLDAFNWLGVKGYSVTIPHKEAILSRTSNYEGLVGEIGAANTLFQDEDQTWWAANTDCAAALDSMRLAYPNHPAGSDPLSDKKVLLMGAGGAGRAIGLGLVRAGAALTVTNRSHERAVSLARHLSCQQTTWENRGSVFSDILVNCTSLGMHPNVNENPFAENWLREEMLVFDTVYNPENTLYLKRAKQRGCRVVSGVEMFVRQAAAQFEKFTGQPAPLDVMRASLRKSISAVSG